MTRRKRRSSPVLRCLQLAGTLGALVALGFAADGLGWAVSWAVAWVAR